MATTADAPTLEQVIEEGDVRSLYQPIVDLDTGSVVAHEALARGPAGSPLATPDALFGAAREAGRVAELDRVCRQAAVDGVRAAGAGRHATLFVNVEPASLLAEDGTGPVRLSELEGPDPRVVVEITERALTADPGPLLATIGRARCSGMAIAVDDLGADEAALALLPFLAPDVIKLDLSLIQGRASADVARWVSAALAESERSGATILAEGIETEEHLDRALALGARLGQGWFLGRPGALPATTGRVRPTWEPTTTPPGAGAGSPYRIVTAERPVRTSTKPMLIALSHHLESLAADLSGPGVVLSAFQHRRHFTPGTTRRYAALARSCAFTAAFGDGLEASPVPGVRTAPLGPGDPLLGEWTVVVVGPHEAAALVAQDLGDDGPDADRRFTYAVTHDRRLVVAAAHALMTRL